MAKLDKPFKVPADFKEHDKVYAELQEAASKRPKGQLVGALLKFSVADGYALYRVTKSKPLTLQHVPLWDGYRIDPAYVRGLNLEDVKKRVQTEKLFESFFR